MNYNNQTCPVCGKLFDPNDDIVVCPECATPHHRECWAANGKCANADLHESDYVWSKSEAPEPAEETETADDDNVRICHVCGSENPADIPNCGNCGAYFGENKKDDNAENKCRFCGNTNPDNAKHCNQCGAPLNIDTNATSTAFFGGTPYIAGTDIRLDDKIGENTAGDLALYTRTSAKRYLKKFKKFENGKKASFNFAAFFLSPAWFFYRKLYKIGFVFLLTSVTLSVFGSALSIKAYDALENRYPQIAADYEEISSAYEDFYISYTNPDITEEELMAKSQGIVDIAMQRVSANPNGHMIFFALSVCILCISFFIKLGLSLTAALIADRMYYKKACENLPKINEEGHDEFVRRALISRKGGVSVFAFLACLYGQNYLPGLLKWLADLIKDFI